VSYSFKYLGKVLIHSHYTAKPIGYFYLLESGQKKSKVLIYNPPTIARISAVEKNLQGYYFHNMWGHFVPYLKSHQGPRLRFQTGHLGPEEHGDGTVPEKKIKIN